MATFLYQPEFDYDSVAASNSAECIKHLLPFKGGLLKGLEPHLINADNIQKFLSTAPPETRKGIAKNQKEIDSALVALLRLYGHVESELASRTLDSVAQRAYYNHFANADIEEAKMDFCKLVRSYEVIKEFNLEAIDLWWKVAHFFDSLNVPSSEMPFMEQVLVYRVYPRIDLCGLTNLLLRRLAYLLRISSETVSSGKITVHAEYTSQIHYTYSVIFREDLAEIIENNTVVRNEDKPQLHSRIEPTKESRETAIKSPFLLDTRGSEQFNQTHAYILEVNEARFSLEEAKIKKSMYIETHLGAEEEALRQDLIRKFISAARNKDRVGEYRVFLMNYFQFARDTLMMQQTNVPEEEHSIFLYHFGPFFFARICAHFMKVARTGYVHRHLKRNQMARELPFEYVKYVLKDWWDENVYTIIPRAERNNPISYERILEGVRSEWQERQLRLLVKIKKDPILLRALNLHDIETLSNLVETEISYLYRIKVLRFLGRDFFYLPIHLSKMAPKS
ncbi:MAG: hypothetical protein LDLANPLL_00975 [Turneriella sp.]|nr:hypothetical protein [Turneriella sp.]